jgi:hypothetical protein
MPMQRLLVHLSHSNVLLYSLWDLLLASISGDLDKAVLLLDTVRV